MANVPFAALHDQVLPYLPGAEKPIVDSTIRKVVREFLKRTTLAREAFNFATVQNIATYKLTPTFGQVSSIISVWDAQGRLLPVATEEVRRHPISPGQPKGWFTTIPDLLSVYPFPSGVHIITVEAAITLKNDAVTFPIEIYDHHAEALAAGVLAMMFSMPGKPWTQTKAAQESGRLFSGAIRTIRGSLRDGGQPNQSTFTGIARFGA